MKRNNEEKIARSNKHYTAFIDGGVHFTDVTNPDTFKKTETSTKGTNLLKKDIEKIINDIEEYQPEMIIKEKPPFFWKLNPIFVKDKTEKLTTLFESKLIGEKDEKSYHNDDGIEEYKDDDGGANLDNREDKIREDAVIGFKDYLFTYIFDSDDKDCKCSACRCHTNLNEVWDAYIRDYLYHYYNLKSKSGEVNR
jgi:hypothetical protein